MGILTGIAAGAQAIGGLMQRRSEKKAATKQFERTKELQDRAHDQQKDMWDYTNYPNQVKMMQEAGLNPALMYGQGGGGGTTAGSGNMGSVNQEQVSNAGANAAQAAMMMSQIELTKAQTEKTKVEADKIAGVDTAESEARTGALGVQTELNKLDVEIKDRTKDSVVREIFNRGQQMLNEATIGINEQKISNATYNEEIRQIKLRTTEMQLENQLKGTNIQLNKERIREISEQILQRWEQIDVSREGLEVSKENMKKLTNAMLWGAGINAAGNVVNSIVDIVASPVKSFSNWNK